MADTLKVELKRHIGKQKVSVGGAEQIIDVDHKQCYVMVNGKQVAWYCGCEKEPGKFLSFIVWLPEPVQEQISKEVAKLTGGPVGNVGSIPPEEHEVASDE